MSRGQEVPPALAQAIGLMDRLRSPGGCPWDAQQTHASLAPYAIEEAYEVAEAAEAGDSGGLQEELGDLLLQVLFHARVAAERPGGFALGDVAEGLCGKLITRHPHVFGAGTAGTAAEVEASWEAIKATEKQREHPLDGIPVALPALARAQKVLTRAERHGLSCPEQEQGCESAPAAEAAPGAASPAAQPSHAPEQSDAQAQIGARLLAVVDEARRAGVDAEAALRERVRALEAGLRQARGAAPEADRPQARRPAPQVP